MSVYESRIFLEQQRQSGIHMTALGAAPTAIPHKSATSLAYRANEGLKKDGVLSGIDSRKHVSCYGHHDDSEYEKNEQVTVHLPAHDTDSSDADSDHLAQWPSSSASDLEMYWEFAAWHEEEKETLRKNHQHRIAKATNGLPKISRVWAADHPEQPLSHFSQKSVMGEHADPFYFSSAASAQTLDPLEHIKSNNRDKASVDPEADVDSMLNCHKIWSAPA